MPHILFLLFLKCQFLGAMSIDWDCIQRSRQKTTNTMVTACDSSLLSAKVNYFYNLLGPAITINTACSSAMVAFHTASQALKNGKQDIKNSVKPNRKNFIFQEKKY